MAVNFSGSLIISGSIITTSGFTGSFSGSMSGTATSASAAISASYATSASAAVSSSYATSASAAVSSSYATSASAAVSSSYATSASAAVSSSYATSASAAVSAASATSASYALSSSYALSASYAYNATLFENTASAVFATTGSNTFISTQVISGSILQSGSFTTTGTIIAQTINVQSVTSSVVYSSGSNVFGNSLGNSQVFTGSVLITGSLTIAGNITSNSAAFFAGAVCVSNIISTGASGGRYGTFNAPTNGGYITFEAGGTPFGDLGSYCAQIGTGDATTLLLGTRTGYALALGSNSTERLRITCAGNVLIGTSTISTAVSTNDLLTIGKSGSTSNAIIFSNGVTTNWGFIVAEACKIVLASSNNITFETGASSTERMRLCSNGFAYFACELTAKTLGTNDLLLNNLNYECANYVDGTRGSWLIQEGACDLFIINQMSCKKYKFNLIEIK